jgi:acyl-CoA thioester hydrolase
VTSKPIVYRTSHRIRFSDLDPYDHVSTANYATYFVDHRMAALAANVGWDLARLRTLPFMMFVRRLEIDFLRPARGDQEIVITSFVKSFSGPDVQIECAMVDVNGKALARGLMTVAHVDRATNRATDWPADVTALFFESSDASP